MIVHLLIFPIGGLNYIGLGVGLTAASQINALYMDRIYIHLKNKNGGVGEPEFRVPSMILGSLLLPFGLLMSGWAAEEAVHWIVTDIVSNLFEYSLDVNLRKTCYLLGYGTCWRGNHPNVPVDANICCGLLHVACC